MFGFKKLVRRIKSLEDALGFSYHQADHKDDCEEHVGDDYGYSGLQKRVTKIEVGEVYKK